MLKKNDIISRLYEVFIVLISILFFFFFKFFLLNIGKEK